MKSKLSILQSKQFFFIDSNKIIMMEKDIIELVNFIDDKTILKDKADIHEELFLDEYLYVNIDK